MKNDEKMRWKTKSLIWFWLSCVVFLSSAWKNVGMTVTCNRCDVLITDPKPNPSIFNTFETDRFCPGFFFLLFSPLFLTHALICVHLLHNYA